MDNQALLDQVYTSFGGQNANQGQQIAFSKVATDLTFSPTQIALELAKQNAANAVNSSIDSPSASFSKDSTIYGNTKAPGKYPVTQAFGNRSGVEVFSGGINTGVDIGAPKNTPIYLPNGKWKVVNAFNGAKNGYVGDNENSGYGNSVLVQNLKTGEKLRFSHLNTVNIPSDVMQGGQAIGLSGATGNVTGPHVDIEYKTPTGQLADFLNTAYAQEVGL